MYEHACLCICVSFTFSLVLLLLFVCSILVCFILFCIMMMMMIMVMVPFLFSKDRQCVHLGGKQDGGDLGGTGKGEVVIRIYCMEKTYFQ